MKCSIRIIGAGILLALLTGVAYAGEAGQGGDLKSYMLAQNEASSSNAAHNVASAAAPKQTEFKEPIFSLNKAHEYLGISTIIAAALTTFTAPGEGCEQNCPPPSQMPPRQTNGTHAHLARATVALAAASIATGIAAHWDDIHLENGITDPDNLHALLGLAGTALMAAAVNKSAKSTVPVSHAGQAELGAALMVVGIKLVW